MNLNYRILCYEDATDFVEEDIKPSLEAFLEEHGFALTFDHRRTFKASEEIDYESYDVILTDLNLGGGSAQSAAGSRIIAKVRQGELLTDIIFYSASVPKLEEALKNKGFLERVSVCYGRAELLPKVKAVILLTVRKVQSVQNMRGLFISESIELEHKIADLLDHCDGLTRADWAALPPAVVQEFGKKIEERMQSRLKSLAKYDRAKHGQLWKQPFVESAETARLLVRIAEDMLQHASKKLESVSRGDEPSLKEHISGLKPIVRELRAFEADVIRIRNNLAHVVSETDPATGKTVLRSRKAGGSAIVFDELWCAEQRKTLRKHHKNLADLLAVLKPV